MTIVEALAFRFIEVPVSFKSFLPLAPAGIVLLMLYIRENSVCWLSCTINSSFMLVEGLWFCPFREGL